MKYEKWLQYLDLTLQHGKLENHDPNYDILNKFMEYLPSQEYPRILEVGAGAGVDMRELIERGYDVEGIDLLPINIKYAHEHFGLEIFLMDMHDLNFPGGSFDGILTIQTFEHALSPFIVASEMHRVLRCGGRVFLDTPDADDEGMYQKWHPSVLYPNQLIHLFKSVGFELVKNLSRKHRTQIVFEKRDL